MESIATLVFALGALIFLCVRASHAGGLWRDEANSVRIATLPTFDQIWRGLPYDSFPLLFDALLRTFVDVVGSNDLAFRWCGFAVGVLIIATAWWSARAAAPGRPVVLLAILGTNATLLVTGTAVRGYGIGSVFILVAFDLARRAMLRPQPLTFVGLGVVSICSVQLLYFALPLIGAILLATITVFLLQKRWTAMAIVAGIGAACLASWIPYFVMYRGVDWWRLLVRPVALREVGTSLGAACGNKTALLALIWLGLLGATLVGAASQLVRLRSQRTAPTFQLRAFVFITALAALAMHFLFLRRLQYWPEDRYFLALVVLCSAAIDVLLRLGSAQPSARAVRLAIAGLIFLIGSITAWPKIIQRQTNIDLVADFLKRTAQSEDLIVVERWPVGVSFHRYFSGRAAWETVPPIADHRLHRYDLVQSVMMQPAPIGNLLKQIATTLQSGHEVWFVQDEDEKPGQRAAPVGPPPDPRVGWHERAYRDAWIAEVRQFIQAHAQRTDVALPESKPRPFENAKLVAAQGWRD